MPAKEATETKAAAQKYSRERLIEDAVGFFGVQRYVVAAALSGGENDLTLDEANKLIAKLEQ